MDDQQSENKKENVPAAPSPAAPAGAQIPQASATSPSTAPKAAEKIADHPHPITIRLGLIGLVSPLVAVLALYISVRALHINERSLEIGQRAYVSLQNGKMVFGHIILEAPGSARPPTSPQSRPSIPPGSEQLATVLISVTIINSGNTPAQFTSFTPNFQLPEGWTLKKQEWQPLQKFPTEVGSKSQEVWEHRASFVLTPQAWSDYLQGPRAAFRFSGRLAYRDVFSAEHTVDWCWAGWAHEDKQGYVSDCDKYTFERVKP